MPKSRAQKAHVLDSLVEKASRAKSVVFASFNGFGVKDNEELRKALRAENSEYVVAKKTLLNLTFKKANLENANLRELPGQLAAVFGYGDEVAPAKIVARFKKEKDGKVDLAGGILENRFIGATEVQELATLPSKEELLGRLVGSINAPVSGFVNVLAGNLRGLVTVLKAIGEKE